MRFVMVANHFTSWRHLRPSTTQIVSQILKQHNYPQSQYNMTRLSQFNRTDVIVSANHTVCVWVTVDESVFYCDFFFYKATHPTFNLLPETKGKKPSKHSVVIFIYKSFCIYPITYMYITIYRHVTPKRND